MKDKTYTLLARAIGEDISEPTEVDITAHSLRVAIEDLQDLAKQEWSGDLYSVDAVTIGGRTRKLDWRP